MSCRELSTAWAVINITTVGYGDIVPVLGQFVASMIMIIGYAIIAVPAGFFTVAMVKAALHKKQCKVCKQGNDMEAKYCDSCGVEMK